VVLEAVWEAWVVWVVLDAEEANRLVADLAVVGAVELVDGAEMRGLIQDVEIDLVLITIARHMYN
jgi:hypothetical protein